MNEKISKALGVFLETMRPIVVAILEKNFKGQEWDDVFFGALPPAGQKQWKLTLASNDNTLFDYDKKNLIDYANLVSFALNFKDQLADEAGGKREANRIISCLQELQDVRNRCQHFQPIDDDDTERAFSDMKTVAKVLELQDLYDEVAHIAEETSQPAPSEQPTAPAERPKDDATPVANSGRLKAWFNNAIPHYDIRNSVLDESMFAANLNDVANGTGLEVYSNPVSFFEKTYITDGLRDIARRVVSALNGEESENRVISLQTGFGGGKTHTMISVYHVAKLGRQLSTMAWSTALLGVDVRPTFDAAHVAVFTNNTTDVVQGRQVEDGLTIYTLWGEIAYQLGGREGYERVKQNDIERTAPSAAIIKPLLEQNGPALILIDELADYCNKAASKKVGASTLYNQTVSFVQALTEVVAAVPRCVLIASLPASATEVSASKIGTEILSSLETRIVRVGSNIKPVDDEEIYEVVRRRLFERFESEAEIENVANSYKNTYHNVRSYLPSGSDNMAYINKIKKAYPFHPELIDLFRLRWGSDPRFQRTRGVLRLLASIVQDLWNRRRSLEGAQALIHTSDVNLENLATITGTINNLMGSNWDTVMQADVYGTSSNAYKIDNEDPMSNIGRYHLTQGLATTLMMASVGKVQNKGLDMRALKLAVVRPDAFNHNDVDTAMNKLEDIAHYLYVSNATGGRTYWFHSKPNINILINQAKSDVKLADMDAEIVRRLNSAAQSVMGMKVLVAPSNDIPEQKALTMVVLAPKYSMPMSGVSREVETIVKEIALNRGSADRIYRNTIFYLAPTEVGMATLRDKLSEYLACKKILEEYASQLERDQKAEVSGRRDDCEKSVSEAIIGAYTKVLKYGAKTGLDCYDITRGDSNLKDYLAMKIPQEMKEQEVLVESIGRGQLERAGLLPSEGNDVQVCKIYDAFLRFDDKPMLLSNDAVKNAVNRYCKEGLFKVAVKQENKIKRLYSMETVPFLEVGDEGYWLVDSSTTLPSSAQPEKPAEGCNQQPKTPENAPKPEDEKPAPTTKTYRQVTISGNVPMENWTQLFPSFINTLKGNNLQIEVTFKAKSTTSNPLTETSATIRSVKESASQLGLDFEAE